MMINIPEVETERLVLKAPSIENLPAMNTFFASQRSRFVGGPCDEGEVWRGLLRTLGHWAVRGYGFWHVEEKASGAWIGYTGFLYHIEWPEPELGWGVAEAFEGKGYMYEAAMGARAAGARLFGLNGVISLIDPENTRSRKLAERMGAQFEREAQVKGYDCHIYRHPKESV